VGGVVEGSELVVSSTPHSRTERAGGAVHASVAEGRGGGGVLGGEDLESVRSGLSCQSTGASLVVKEAP
jgi:hypothetical protein